MNRRLLYIVGIALIYFLLFIPVLTGQRMILGDLMNQLFPVHYYYGKQLTVGVFPLWAPELNYGVPFLAETQTGLLYPPNLVFGLVAYHLGPSIWQVDLVLHLIMGTVFYFYFFNKIGLDDPIAFFCAMAVHFSGFFVAHVAHASFLHSLCWSGGMLYFLHSFAFSGRLRLLVGFCITALMSMSAGVGPGFFLSALISTLYGFFILTQQKARLIVLKPGLLFRSIPVIFLLLGIPAIFFLGVSGPHYENSIRASWSREMFFGFHASVRSFWHFIYGNWFKYRPDPGSFEYDAYNSIIIVFLAIVGISTRIGISPQVWFWSFFVFIGLIFAHAVNPIYEFVFDHVPIMNKFRVPGRFILISSLGLVVLAGMGLQEICNGRLQKKFRWWIPAVLIPVLLFLPWYKNKEYLPLEVESFYLFLPDAISILLIFILYFGITRVKVIQTYKLVTVLLVTLIGSVIYFKQTFIPPFKLEAPYQCNQEGRCMADRFEDTLGHNYDLLFDRWAGAGYLTLEMQSAYEFKKAIHKNPESSGLRFAGAYGAEASYAWLINHASIVRPGVDTLEMLKASQVKCPLIIKNQTGANHLESATNIALDCLPLELKKININLYQIQIPENDFKQRWVYISQSYYPGWHAVDQAGLALNVYRANHHFMAIPITPSAKRIDLKQKLYWKLNW